MAWDFEQRDAPPPDAADGPTEVHKVTVARQVLRGYSASDDLWPSQHIPRRLADAREEYAEYLEHEIGNQ